ncbi:ABC transporter permease [Desulfogranum japonicum]|uniref:ABC transporter permease n=1 Tax=Desulfogranum japonicum TaxID=231447 RepID=UPI0003FDAA67|nr:FtsX-like permease family protein [Desulfogranum japonicum]
MNTILHPRFLYREMAHGWRHGLIFVLCVALSLTTLIALNSFKGGVHATLFRDARELQGADIIIHSHYPLSPALQKETDTLVQRGEAVSTMVHEFYSVVRTGDERANLYSKVKVVDQHFPLYGKVELQSGKEIASQLRKGTVIVAEDVLKRLELSIGETLNVGARSLKIVDVVIHEPDSPSNLLNFGPRVFVAADDLEQLDLVKKGSRVQYERLLKLTDEHGLAAVVERLRTVAVKEQERVNSYQEEGSRIKRFFDNLLFFLSLISIFTLLLAGLGMQSCLTALVRQKQQTIAIARAFGATNRFVYRHYLLIVLQLGILGSILGIASGWIIGSYLPVLFQGLLPIDGATTISFADVGEGISLGLAVVVLFTFLPLHQLRNIKPVAMFRGDSAISRRSPLMLLAIFFGVVLITLLVIRHLEDVTVGFLFMAGVLALITITAFCAKLLLYAVQKIHPSRLTIRQSLRSITRQGNATSSILVTLSSALALLSAIYLIERNLHASYIDSYPEGAPNLFCIDIQPDQREGFTAFFDKPPELFPIIRARLTAINDTPINRQKELLKKRDNFAREFNLTYRNFLLEDERIIEGGELFPLKQAGKIQLQVSVLDDVVSMGDLKLGDMLRFNIQGVELEAQVSSIRTRTKSMLHPFFYFVFPAIYLQDAPQTFFSAVTLEEKSIADIQRQILRQYPNISFINVSETARKIEVLILKLTDIINFFSAFSILAGCLILVSSILATRMARIREAVYYKIVGGTKGFVYRVLLYENCLLGLFTGIIALLLAHAISWGICTFFFDITYTFFGGVSALLLLVTITLIVATGMLSSINVVTQKPAQFLREHTSE